MNNYIYILTHGFFGKELVASGEMIMGELENVKTFSLEENMSVEDYIELVSKELRQDEGKKLFLVDLYGGTPFNVSAYMLKNHDIDIITGVSLPLLIESYEQHIINGNLNISELLESSNDFVRHINEIK